MFKDDCFFCKVTRGLTTVPSVDENGSAILIKDKNPVAPHHVLCISRDHYDNIGETIWSGPGWITFQYVRAANKLCREKRAG